MMTVMTVMAVVWRLSKCGCGHTENHDEEECNLFHSLIVDSTGTD
jgi:hypothetical protein